ncbi:hypothetical protein [Gulosibacter sediminis]|uniref:hypothetical protein n=1 Tax=Gulosibacter sediminis TaxID=1729695 RepID=UPI0024A84D6B|nr:hypothetical protein [Gulosibacter sediminis]
MTAPAPYPQRPQKSIRRRIGTGFIIAAGVVIFALVVWLSFSLGFSRLRADLDIEMKTAVEAEPEVRFDGVNQGWERMNPDAKDESPQYLNVTEDEETPCIFSWETGKYDSDLVDVPNDLNDRGASDYLVERLGYTEVDDTSVQVETTGELTVELIYAQETMDDGVTVASAVRAFTGSQHYIAFLLTCQDAEALDPGLMMSVLDDVKLDIEPVR